MQKVKILRKMSYLGSIKTRGKVISVTNNEAHGMIESGMARIYTDENKMMTPSKRSYKRGGYKIK